MRKSPKLSTIKKKLLFVLYLHEGMLQGHKLWKEHQCHKKPLLVHPYATGMIYTTSAIISMWGAQKHRHTCVNLQNHPR